MKWENELTKTFKIKYPVIQAPMLGVTTPEMVAAIAAQGGLGSLPVGGMSPDQTLELIRKTRALTNSPFAVNLFANPIPTPDKKVFESMQDTLEKICMDNELPFVKKPLESIIFYSYTEQIDILLRENISVVSFTFGVLNKEAIKAFKERNVALTGTATCLKEAYILDQSGIDFIIAQGIEAGGHRGTFLQDEPLPLVGTMSLIQQLEGHLHKPIIAAGGISDGRAIKAAFILGAKGVQIGTAFIASEESAAIPSYKAALHNAMDTDIILTKSLTGRWARGLKNKFITAIEASGTEIPAYPIQGSLTAVIRTTAQQQNNKEFTSLLAGQSAFKAEMKPVADIFNKLIKQSEEYE